MIQNERSKINYIYFDEVLQNVVMSVDGEI